MKMKDYSSPRTDVEQELHTLGIDTKGNSCRCPDPDHEDKTASATILDDGRNCRVYCHVCKKRWDLSDLRGLTQGTAPNEPRKQARSSGKSPMTLCDVRSWIEKKRGAIQLEHTYRDPQGDEIMKVFRFIPHDGIKPKDYLPATRKGGGWVIEQLPKPWPLYNLPEIAQAKTIVVVEGEKKADALGKYGIVATTGPHGAGKAQHADWTVLAGKQVILWPDCDQPGRDHIDQVQTIVEALTPRPQIKILEPTDLDLEHKEDACDHIEQCRIAGMDVRCELLKALAKARGYSASSGLLEQIEDTIAGRRECVPWPWPGLSRLCRALMPAEITLICGDPGSSKSFFVTQWLLFCLRSGVRICVFELEDDLQHHLQRVLSQLDENSNLTDPTWIKANSDQARGAYARHKTTLDEAGRYITEATGKQLTLDELAAWVERQAKAGYRVIVVDPVTCAMQTSDPWKSDCKFVNTIKATAKTYRTSVVLITHSKKANRGKMAPGLNDLAGGAAYQRFCHNIVWIERHTGMKTEVVLTNAGRFEAKFNRTIHLCKVRNGPGTGLKLAYQFSADNLLFSEQGIILGKQK